MSKLAAADEVICVMSLFDSAFKWYLKCACRSFEPVRSATMSATFPILANTAASITDLKRDPMGTIRGGEGETVVILNRNEPAFYAVPPDVYEAMLDMLDDLQLAEVVRSRLGGPTVEVDIDDLLK